MNCVVCGMTPEDPNAPQPLCTQHREEIEAAERVLFENWWAARVVEEAEEILRGVS